MRNKLAIINRTFQTDYKMVIITNPVYTLDCSLICRLNWCVFIIPGIFVHRICKLYLTRCTPVTSCFENVIGNEYFIV